METPQNSSQWERSVLEKIALDGLAEQRRRRRWGIFFKLLGFIYLGVILGYVIDWGRPADKLGDGGHTALVQLSGVIQAKGDASADSVISGLDAAFADKGTKGVILRINSPGGSPVQSGMINDEIWRLRALHPAIPLYVVVEDICASGGYYVASAANKIFVDKASIVGSIGVLMDGFGFTGAMEKLGVERRLLTAGKYKGFLDPFSPQDAQQKAYAQVMLDDIHQQFIDAVRKGRGKRLKETPETFSGLMWTGAKSVEMGLADGYGTVDSVARDVIKADQVRDYTVKQNLAEKFAKQIGAQVSGGVVNALTRMTLR
ncbi:putative signal peptide peptidase SppA [mine drainage metagenome]|uniref:Putative signal peptide peptidase SppA n=1 Tax=mine drainage metagenome TaxID=410659 RepID=A0A1J5STU9_9ZZZZ